MGQNVRENEISLSQVISKQLYVTKLGENLKKIV